MSAERWEYLSLARRYSVEQRTRKKDPAPSAESGEDPNEQYWFYEHTYYISVPGSTQTETRKGWSNDNPNSELSPHGLLNEFGAQGWELVSETVGSSKVNTNLFGWISTAASEPIDILWRLKRRIAP
jgi:hypothetical protein